jgi:hypothetical protein
MCFIGLLARGEEASEQFVDLKGHGFRCATKSPKRELALAAEGMQATGKCNPSGAETQHFFAIMRHG